MATSKINNPMAWKLQGTASGQNTIALPSDFNELMWVVTYGTYFFQGIVCKSDVSVSDIYPRFTFYYNSSNYCGGYVRVNASTIRVDVLNENGASKLSSASLKLYYR